jgi:hypothetical protein
MKKVKGNREFHVPNTKKGTGEFFGVGVKNNIGKSLQNSIVPKMGNKKLGKPPKSLA